MKKSILHRALQFIITLIGATFLTFCLTYIAPGDPAATVLETAEIQVSQELLEQTRHEMGLDKPFLLQYTSWVGGAMTGDLGMSYSAKKPVVDKLMESLPGTALLAFMASIFMLLISIPGGIISAMYRNKMPDHILRIFSFFAVSMPTFWLGLLLLYVFGVKLHLFTIGSASVSLETSILPAATLALAMTGKYVRQIRLIVLEEMQKDYVIGARARGMKEMDIMFKHIIPNAILPLITLFGTFIGWLFGGVAVVEMIFAWPGLGRMAVNAIAMRDYPLVEGFVLWAALAYMVINFLVDLSYGFLDPRLRKGGKA